MIKIEDEGFVAVKNNKIPLVNYLFYLTYNERASIKSNFKDIDFSSSNLYETSNKYNNKLKDTSSRKKGVEVGEIVMSLSPDLCALVVKHKFKNNIDDFVENFKSACDQILNESLEQKEYAIFIHEFDSTQMRVHAHVLFYPYINHQEIKLQNTPPQTIESLKVWIEPKRLEEIKKNLNLYARALFKNLEGKKSDFNTVDYPTDDLFSLIKMDKSFKTSRRSSSLVLNDWGDRKYKTLQKAIEYLDGTQDDKKLEQKNDLSIIIDYLHDYEDPKVYTILMNHKALKSIVKDFSLNKSVSKFSVIFLKLIQITRRDEVLNIIKDKINNKKGQELKNILIRRYMGDSFIRSNNLTRNQTKTKTKTQK
jgi:hypothetical protein